jgi:hypothetical protein
MVAGCIAEDVIFADAVGTTVEAEGCFSTLDGAEPVLEHPVRDVDGEHGLDLVAALLPIVLGKVLQRSSRLAKPDLNDKLRKVVDFVWVGPLVVRPWDETKLTFRRPHLLDLCCSALCSVDLDGLELDLGVSNGLNVLDEVREVRVILFC